MKNGKPLTRKTRLAPGAPLERTPIAKVGKRTRRNRTPDAQWSLAVRERAGGLCERLCGMPGCDPHHLHTKARRPDLRHDVRNGAWLCRQCHDWAQFTVDGVAWSRQEAERRGLV